MKISSIIVPGIGTFALLMFSSCSSTDGDGYAESALPMSEVADGEIPPWLLEDDGTQQVGAGSHTPTASRNDYSIPEPTDTKPDGGVSQNHPQLAENSPDDTIVEAPKPEDIDPLATSAPVVNTGSGEATNNKVAVSGKKNSGKKGGKKIGKKPKQPTMIVYKVRPGDNLSLIAKRSNTTVEQIRKDSNIKGSTIYPGQTIKVRYTPNGYKAAKSSKKSDSPKKKDSGKKNGSSKTHTVTSGQTLSGIAAKYGVSVSSLMKANGISKSEAGKIRIGRKLTIPSTR